MEFDNEHAKAAMAQFSLMHDEVDVADDCLPPGTKIRNMIWTGWMECVIFLKISVYRMESPLDWEKAHDKDIFNRYLQIYWIRNTVEPEGSIEHMLEMTPNDYRKVGYEACLQYLLGQLSLGEGYDNENAG